MIAGPLRRTLAVRAMTVLIGAGHEIGEIARRFLELRVDVQGLPILVAAKVVRALQDVRRRFCKVGRRFRRD